MAYGGVRTSCARDAVSVRWRPSLRGEPAATTMILALTVYECEPRRAPEIQVLTSGLASAWHPPVELALLRAAPAAARPGKKTQRAAAPPRCTGSATAVRRASAITSQASAGIADCRRSRPEPFSAALCPRAVRDVERLVHDRFRPAADSAARPGTPIRGSVHTSTASRRDGDAVDLRRAGRHHARLSEQ